MSKIIKEIINVLDNTEGLGKEEFEKYNDFLLRLEKMAELLDVMSQLSPKGKEEWR